MIRFKSILSRVVVLHIIAVAITSILMSVALSWLLTVATTTIHNEAMQEQAETIARNLAISNSGDLSLHLPIDLQGLYSQPYGRYSFAVVDDRGMALFSSLKDPAAIFPIDPRAPRVQFVQKRKTDAPISGASVRHVIGTRTVYIQAAEDLANRDVLTDDIVADFYRSVGWITLPILLVLLVVDIAIFRRALYPLRQASETARSIGPARTDIRLPVAEIPSEVRPLVDAVNQALGRLDQGFRIQREFTADAAHELRTPLSVLRARVDMLEDRSVAASLKQDIEAMGHIVGQLLDIAELDALTIDADERTDLRKACEEIVESVAPLALHQGREISLIGAADPVWVLGNAEMIKRALSNLADNALKHTPLRTAVEFAVEESGSVVIRDNGAGIREEDRDHIFRRFWRRERGKPGSSGLGLPIVHRIVELHGAGIRVENQISGGAQFTIQFQVVAGAIADAEGERAAISDD